MSGEDERIAAVIQAAADGWGAQFKSQQPGGLKGKWMSFVSRPERAPMGDAIEYLRSKGFEARLVQYVGPVAKGS